MGDKPKTLKEEIWQWRDAAIDCAELKSSTAWILAVLSTKMKPYQPWLVNVGQVAKWAKLSRKSAGQHLQLAVKAGFLLPVEKTGGENRPGRLHALKEYTPRIPGVPEGWDYGIQWREGAEPLQQKDNVPDSTGNHREVDMRRTNHETRSFTDSKGVVRDYDRGFFQNIQDQIRQRGRSNLTEEVLDFYDEMTRERERRAGIKSRKQQAAVQGDPAKLEQLPAIRRMGMGEEVEQLCQTVLGKLRMKHGEATYNSWIKPLAFIGVEGGSVSFAVPTRFMRDWILSHYAEDILVFWREDRPEMRAVEVRIGRVVLDA